MQFKLFVVALLGACVLQVTFADLAYEDYVERRGFFTRGTINKAKHAIYKVSSLITNTVNNGLYTLNNLKDLASLQVNKATEVVKEKLKDVIAQANESIKKITDKSRVLGIDISECVSDNQALFKKLFETLFADEISCITEELNEALKIINDSITTVQNAVSAIISFSDKLDECNSSSMCIMKLVLKVGLIEIQVPTKMAKTISETTVLVSGLQVRLEICATSQLPKAGIETAKVVAKVTKCASDKGVK